MLLVCDGHLAGSFAQNSGDGDNILKLQHFGLEILSEFKVGFGSTSLPDIAHFWSENFPRSL